MTAAPDAKPAQQGADDAAAAAPKAARATRGTAAHETNLGTVTVTARRRKESIQDVPVAVSALSGDTIKNNELRVVNDVTKYVPNFTGQSTEGRERPRWFPARRRQQRSVGPVAGRSACTSTTSTSTACSGRASRCSTSIASKCCAPAGTLWGKNTVGGALSITSQKPTFDVSGYGKIEPASTTAGSRRPRSAGRSARTTCWPRACRCITRTPTASTRTRCSKGASAASTTMRCASRCWPCRPRIPISCSTSTAATTRAAATRGTRRVQGRAARTSSASSGRAIRTRCRSTRRRAITSRPGARRSPRTGASTRQ